MIQSGTLVHVSDNSGVKTARCIHVFKKGRGSSRAKVGDVILVSVQRAKPGNRIKAGDLRKALVLQTKQEQKRQDGHSVRMNQYQVILIQNKPPVTPLAKRFFTGVGFEYRHLKKISLLSTFRY